MRIHPRRARPSCCDTRSSAPSCWAARATPLRISAWSRRPRRTRQEHASSHRWRCRTVQWWRADPPPVRGVPPRRERETPCAPDRRRSERNRRNAAQSGAKDEVTRGRGHGPLGGVSERRGFGVSGLKDDAAVFRGLQEPVAHPGRGAVGQLEIDPNGHPKTQWERPHPGRACHAHRPRRWLGPRGLST